MTSTPSPADAQRPVVGLALSGGGSRASFQLGALRYLYDVLDVTPSVITGTSAGSIIAAVLAQYADYDGQRVALARLVELWGEMDHQSDMFTELPWFTRLRERGPVWFEALERPRRRDGVLGRSFRRVAHRQQVPAAEVAAATAEVTVDAVANKSAPATGEDSSTGPDDTESGWSPAKLIESIEMLRTLGRAGPELAQIIAGAQRERSMFRPGPLVDRLLDPESFQAERVTRSGVVLRIAMVGLESGELHYVTEDGTVVDRDNRPLPGREQVELALGVRASCAIPMVFPPVLLGGENYVDGGVRESLPTDIALTRLGVDTCYAVVAGPDGVPPEESYTDKDMLSIVLRTTTGIMADEVQRDESHRAARHGAVVISPEFDVHPALSVDPGLVGIAMDYGYIRAAEAHEFATPEEIACTREVIELRREIWRAEEAAFGPLDAERRRQYEEARAADLAGIGERKRELRDLLSHLPADRLPPEATDWWQRWERHTFEIPLEPGWVPASR